METSTKLVDTIVPVYASYDLAKAFAVYTVAEVRPALREEHGRDGLTSSGLDHLVGATAGMRLGNKCRACSSRLVRERTHMSVSNRLRLVPEA